MQGIGKHVAVMALAAVVAGGAQAQSGNKQGPRSSVSVDTVCFLSKDYRTFNVEVRVRDKSSNSLGATVTAWDIKALAKVDSGNWTQQTMFASRSATGLNLQVPSGGSLVPPITQSFSLCAGDTILPELATAKGLNAMVTTTYGNGTVANMCSDDPNTLDVVEPSGIKLSPTDLLTIAAMCKATPY